MTACRCFLQKTVIRKVCAFGLNICLQLSLKSNTMELSADDGTQLQLIVKKDGEYR
jgi:hypothetical protein